MTMENTEEFIIATIRQFVRVARKYVDAENLPIPVESHGDISTREAHIIEAIGDTPEINITALAGQFGVSKSAAQMITKLERKGFVDKSPAPHSNKEYILTLTDLGWRGYAAHERFSWTGSGPAQSPFGGVFPVPGRDPVRAARSHRRCHGQAPGRT